MGNDNNIQVRDILFLWQNLERNVNNFRVVYLKLNYSFLKVFLPVKIF